ncbi:MAG: hypothetical protein HZA63_09675, partial [Rhodocyclales bacterium]|nr:hypothetical protein [Rhodocyclales bacterium]
MSTVLAFKPLEQDMDTPEAKAATRVAPPPANVAVSPAPTSGSGAPAGEKLRDVLRVVIPPLFGIALMIGIWALVAIKSGNIPGP